MKKQHLGKRIISFMMVVALFAACLAGCSGSESISAPPRETIPHYTSPEITIPESTAPEVTIPESYADDMLVAEDGESIRYVMIYNPRFYTDLSSESRNSGSFASQVNVDISRGDELTENPESIPYEQVSLPQELLDKVDLSGGKADGLGKIYKVGDQEYFYCGSEYNINTRVSQKFTCVYAGTHANIWSYDSANRQSLLSLGTSFDSTIYDACVSRFGEARFGEVVNILVYPFTGNQNTIGFFCNYDLFSFLECDDATAQQFGVNRDINVININSLWLADMKTATSTLAHEFQHLLCFTGFFANGNLCDVWFNEAMSAYIEEVLYTGAKENSVASFKESNRIRNGQSLYNFEIDVSQFKFDIGVYGSVFLFSEYLKNIAGEDVFNNFHKNWRNTYVPMSTAEGIYKAIPQNVQNEIDNLIHYPADIQFNSSAEEWMSKLTLSFYLSTLTMDENAASNYKDVVLPYLLYDSISSAQIEGGGRIMLALNDTTYEIPEDADPGLVYVGLNEDLEIVTDLICK